jgi:hypothetical protein
LQQESKKLYGDFDRDLVRDLYEAVLRGDDHIFRDPRYPYQATLNRKGTGYLITVEDARKRWWGRTVDKQHTIRKPVSGSSTQGPAFEALMMVQSCIDAEKGLAAQKAALKKR